MTQVVSSEALDKFIAFVELGTSLLIATRDHARRSEVTRVAAARLFGARLQVLVPLPEGERTLSNIKSTRAVALTAAHPTTYRSFQIKGSDAEPCDWPEHRAAAEQHVQRFVAEVSQLGLPVEIAAFFWSRAFVPIAFTPHSLFTQTPGPGAGQPVST